MAATPLEFPHAAPPAPGSLIEIAPGVRWFRLPLPYRLDHVNIYLIEDDGRLDGPRHRPGHRRVPDGLGIDPGRTAGGSASHLDDRDAFPSRSCRPRGLARSNVRTCSFRCHVPSICTALALHMPPATSTPLHRPSIVATGFPGGHGRRSLSRGPEYLRLTTGVPTPMIGSSTATFGGSAPGHSRRS